jgi:hypothetical protein
MEWQFCKQNDPIQYPLLLSEINNPFVIVWELFSQGVLVFLAAKSGFIKNAEKAAYLQNFGLCVEMLVAAIGHRFAFSYKEYAGSNARPFGGFRGSLLHAMKFNDFYHDTIHQVN